MRVNEYKLNSNIAVNTVYNSYWLAKINFPIWKIRHERLEYPDATETNSSWVIVCTALFIL